jgi:hypothetical protein
MERTLQVFEDLLEIAGAARVSLHARSFFV